MVIAPPTGMSFRGVNVILGQRGHPQKDGTVLLICELVFARRNVRKSELEVGNLYCGFPKMSFMLIETREVKPAVAIVKPIPAAVDVCKSHLFGKHSSLKAD